MTQKAFTLIELAIVIVIIGLIVGGVLGAQSLIKSSERNAAIKEINDMASSIRAFQLEFDATPGVMQDAYDYFGADCGGDNNSAATGCNGESPDDNCIDATSSTCTASFTITRDMRRFPIHMNLSGIRPDIPFISNSTGSTDCPSSIPKSPISDTFIVSSETRNKIYLYFFNASVTNNGTYCILSTSDAFAPRDAYKIDNKIDDGNGRNGKITAMENMHNNFADGACQDGNGIYDLSDPNLECSLRAELQ